MRPLTKLILFSLEATFFLSSCSSKQPNEKVAQPNPVPSFPAVEINARATTLYLSFPAVLQGKQNIEIRPKVDGYIESIYIDEGSVVRKGQKLFKISAPSYDQELHNAAALITSAEAEVNTAQLQVNKTKPLVSKGIISSYELDFAENALKIKNAILAQARAGYVNAQTNVGYTHVNSPVDGIASAVPYKIGSLVSSNTPQPLTTISNNGYIYAYVSLNEKQLLSFSRNYPGKDVAQKLKNVPPVLLTLSDGSSYPLAGKVETVNGLINTQTGSASFRAIFPNPSGLIRSGGSATLKVPQYATNVILVPQKSTYEIQGKHFLYVVSSDNTVKSTEISIAETTTGQLYVVNHGLRVGDKIVVEGTENLKDGMKIKPDIIPTEKLYTELK